MKKEQEPLIHALAQKRYDLKLEKALEWNKHQLQKAEKLELHNYAAIFEELPDKWKPLVNPHVLPDELFAECWLEQYGKSASGDAFKSKAEYICDSILTGMDAPHVYEPKLYLKEYGVVHPDFVILNRRTRQTFFHEHFGMMGDPEYCKKALAKLEDYHKNGFYEGTNLIVTMESALHPMSPEEVEGIFRKHIL